MDDTWLGSMVDECSQLGSGPVNSHPRRKEFKLTPKVLAPTGVAVPLEAKGPDGEEDWRRKEPCGWDLRQENEGGTILIYEDLLLSSPPFSCTRWFA